MTRITIKDVAREAKVSVGSVSKVLNGLPVSVRLKQKVDAAIGQLGYEPNRLAQSMRRRSTGAIGCLVPDISNPLYWAVVKKVDDRLQRDGYMLLLASSSDNGRTEVDIVAEFKRRRVDGLIIAPGRETDAHLIKSLEQFGAPTVILGRSLSKTFSSVHVDYRSGVEVATKYLLDLGHRRIALLAPLAGPGHARVEGFRAAYAQAGLDPPEDLVPPRTMSLDAEHDVRRLLDSADAPTALIVLGTRILAGALKTMRDRNLDTPRDLSIISIGDPEWAAVHNPPITTLRWDVEEVARLVAELFLSQLKKKSKHEPQQVFVSTDLVLRGSCATPVRRAEK